MGGALVDARLPTGMSGRIVSVYATFADAGEAERVGRTVVEERLAACINVLGATTSIYRWRGAIETAAECAAILKTTAQGADRLVRRIVELHSYETPSVVVWPVDYAPPSYADWVEEQVG
jgi:periplasmic divalent cation tolerance protein